jgi:hypothetical protein
MKMSLNAKNIPMAGGGKRADPLEPGTYPARLVQIISLGIQKQNPYQGQEKPPVLEFMLTYEMLDEFLKDEDGEDITDKPRWLSETMALHNLAADKAKSTKRYYALDPNDEHDGDWGELLATPCMVTVVNVEGKGKNAGRVYENISNVSAMRPKEAAKAPALVNPTKLFDFYNPDLEVFKSLPEWLQNKMKEAVDFEGGALDIALSGAEEPEEKPKVKPKAKVKTPEPEHDEESEDW